MPSTDAISAAGRPIQPFAFLKALKGASGLGIQLKLRSRYYCHEVGVLSLYILAIFFHALVHRESSGSYLLYQGSLLSGSFPFPGFGAGWSSSLANSGCSSLNLSHSVCVPTNIFPLGSFTSIFIAVPRSTLPAPP